MSLPTRLLAPLSPKPQTTEPQALYSFSYCHTLGAPLGCVMLEGGGTGQLHRAARLHVTWYKQVHLGWHGQWLARTVAAVQPASHQRYDPGLAKVSLMVQDSLKVLSMMTPKTAVPGHTLAGTGMFCCLPASRSCSTTDCGLALAGLRLCTHIPSSLAVLDGAPFLHSAWRQLSCRAA